MLKKFLIFKTGMLAVKAGLGIFLILFSMWQQSIAYAQALPATPVANFVVNRAVGGIITRVAAARGFAANDPRILTTMNAAGAQLSVVNTAATVAGVGFAIAGAPVWLGIAASLGVLAVGAAIVAGNTTISMDAGKITIAQPLPAGPAYAPVATTSTNGWSLAAAEGVPVYRTSTCLSNDAWCSAFPTRPTTTANFTYSAGTVVLMAATLAQLDRHANLTKSYSYPQFGENWTVSHYWVPNADGTDSSLFRRAAGQEYVYDSATGSYMLKPFDRSQATSSYISVSPASKPLVSSSLNTIYPSIGAAAAAEPVPDSTLAKLVDQAWKNAAAQPGYEGLPYTAVNPVTAAEVQPWTAANPQAVPKIADLLTPASNPNTQVVPISPTVTVGTSPTPTPTPTPTGTADVNVVNTPNVNVTNQISVDLGPNPNTAAPGVPTPPTAQVIFQPFLDLVAPLINYQPPALAGECPRPVFHILGNEITMSSHCDIAENNRGAIQSIMLVVFLIGAVTIVFSA